ncbi:hypothetical protein [Prescottella agglutinans]|uniref:Small CPxCG-related zinc finger protein n=1 Tax=Prescottella agglutinans TaxID=1644129 RepID=A0ABT6MI84_9NOCA|nr:hypothetical protein [Prescottella agglutinans]MDH6284025.1 hypothetical protein [Prescottella agglutinans]
MSATTLNVRCTACGREERVSLFDYDDSVFDLDYERMNAVCHGCVKKGKPAV